MSAKMCSTSRFVTKLISPTGSLKKDVEKQMCSLSDAKAQVKRKSSWFCSALGNLEPIWLGNKKPKKNQKQNKSMAFGNFRKIVVLICRQISLPSFHTSCKWHSSTSDIYSGIVPSASLCTSCIRDRSTSCRSCHCQRMFCCTVWQVEKRKKIIS